MSEDREIEYVPLIVNPADAAFVQYQRWLMEEICRVFSGRASHDAAEKEKTPPKRGCN